jgi:hypothetical protein
MIHLDTACPPTLGRQQGSGLTTIALQDQVGLDARRAPLVPIIAPRRTADTILD